MGPELALPGTLQGSAGRVASAPEQPLCANCGRVPRSDENADDDWRAESDGAGELHVFCPECWQRESHGSCEPNGLGELDRLYAGRDPIASGETLA